MEHLEEKMKEERHCFNPFCDNKIYFEEFKKTNPQLTTEELENCWKVENFKYFCCDCFSRGKPIALLQFLASLKGKEENFLDTRLIETRIMMSTKMDLKEKRSFQEALENFICNYFRKKNAMEFCLEWVQIMEVVSIFHEGWENIH